MAGPWEKYRQNGDKFSGTPVEPEQWPWTKYQRPPRDLLAGQKKPWEEDWTPQKKPWEEDWTPVGTTRIDDAPRDLLAGHPRFGGATPITETDVERAARIRAEYAAKSAPMQIMQAAMDVGDIVSNPFGLRDKAVAAARALARGTEYHTELAGQRQISQDARTRAGSAAIAADLAAPMAAATSGLTLAGRFGTAAMGGAKGLAARSGFMAAEGAGYGALNAYGHDEDIARGAALGAGAGALGNVAGEALSAVGNAVARRVMPQVARPTTESLKAGSTGAYRSADAAGVAFAPADAGKLLGSANAMLKRRGYHPANEPGIAPVLEALDALTKKPGGVTLSEIETVRRVAGNGFRPGAASNNAALAEIADMVDDFVLTANPMTGDSKAAAAALRQAREAWHTASKLETVERLADTAAVNAAASGRLSLDTATRQQLKKVLLNKRTGRGFTEAEKKAVRRAVEGSAIQNLLRDIGEYAPRNAVGVGAHLLPSFASPLLPIATIGGTIAARKASERMQTASMQRLLDVLTKTPAPTRAVSPAARAAISGAIGTGAAVNARNMGPAQ